MVDVAPIESNIRFFRLDKQSRKLKPLIDGAIERVISSDNFILGEEVQAFENEFSAFVGTQFAVGVASGTDAITLALMAIGVSTNDEVITVANTATPTAVAICRSGARPVFVDIEKDGFHMNPQLIEEKITSKTKAILPVHLYGEPASIKTICDIAKKYCIPVVEDACQAHGAEFASKKLGTWGKMGCFSFYPTKNLGGFGDGGMIVLDDEHLYHRLRSLRNYGQRSRYDNVELGMNSRLDEIQAAILRVKLKFIDEWNTKRFEIAQRYSRQINHPTVTTPAFREQGMSAHHLYVVRTTIRDKLTSWLSANGIQTMIHYPKAIHLQPGFSFLNYVPGNLPVTEDQANTVLSLPAYPELPLHDVDKICDTINSLN